MAQAFDPFAKPELLNKTARFRAINALESIYEGKQYEGRPDWWTGRKGDRGEAVPLRERKPCIVYRLPKASCQQVVRFLFGDKRFPKISVASVKDEPEPADADDAVATPEPEPYKTTPDPLFPELERAEADFLTDWVARLVEHANLEPMMRAIALKAIACKTAVVVVEVDRGEFRLTLPRPQDCWAKFADGEVTHEVERLLWCYEFDKEVADETGKPVCKRHVFRREWDAKNVYLYDDVPLEQGKEISWGEPKAVPHGLSFCPALWIRNEPEYGQGVDGRSLIEDLGEEFEALDMALSRRHQGIIYLGVPQLVETGVEAGDGPGADGRKATSPGYGTGQAPEYKVAAPARRIAPDSVWTYEGKDVDVKLLETSGKAFEVGTAHVNDIRSRLLETMGVVLTSMADTVSRVTQGAEMSARFLALAHAPLIALVQEYRHSWWPYGLRPLLLMLMRTTLELAATNQTLLIPGTQDAVKLLAKFKSNDGKWLGPQMRPHWGKFFDPSNAELKTGVEAAVAAKDGHVISARTSAEFVSHDFGVDNVEAELDEIMADKASAMAQQQEDLAAQAKVADNQPPGAKGAAAPKQPPSGEA